MPDVTVKSIDDMEAIYGGLARRARAELGVTAWGMQVAASFAGALRRLRLERGPGKFGGVE